MPRDVKIQSRRGTASEWESVNPVLALGELGVETDTHKIKAGDDETSWNDLPYVTGPVDGDNVSLQVKRDTDANLSALTDPFLSGQLVYGQTTGKTVIGDGESLYDELPDIRDQFQTIVTVRKTGKGKFSCANPAYSTDAECIQAALDHISNIGGGVLHIEKGHYICNTQLLYTNSNLIITGDNENTILDFSGRTNGSAESNWCIYIHGSITTTNSVLSVDALVSTLSVTVAAGEGSKFAAGDWIRIRSNAIFNNWTQHLGEIQQIKSISGDVLTLNEPLHSGYLISDSATVDKLAMLENIHVSDIKMVATNANSNFGIVCTQAHNVIIKNVTAEDVQDRAVYFVDVVSGQMSGCQIKRSNKVALGYGIAIINASRDIVVDKNKFYDCRHGITCGGDTTFGVQYNQIYSNNIQSYNSQAGGAFGPHDTYNGLTVIGNTVIGDSLGYYTGLNTHITGNTIVNGIGSYGIRIVHDSKYTTVVNNHISMLGQVGIQIGGNSEYIRIAGNTINTFTSGHGIFSEYDVSHLDIDNNTINSIGSGIFLRGNSASLALSALKIVNNTLNCGAACIDIDPYAVNVSDLQILNNHCVPGASSSCIELWGSASGGKFSNVQIANNKCVGGVYGITIASMDDIQIYANKISNATYGIYIQNTNSSCSDYTVSNNKLLGCTTPFTDLANSVTKKIFGNPGYKTENTGTATITASQTSVTISHGLVAAPTKIIVTPFGNVGNCWVDYESITATEMTIHCSTAPEADTAVSWSAQVV